jgi:hypothetical protein
MKKAFCKSAGLASLALGILGAAGLASAQPVANVDLGTLTNPSTVTGTLTGFVAGQVQWIKFTLPVGATLAGAGYLDIDTNGGTLTGADSHIGLYTSTGVFLDSNDDSGPSFYSMLSYGRTTPNRPGLAFTGNATSNGSVHAGGSGAADIAADTYSLAVTGFGGNTYAASWVVGTTHTRTGDVAFRIDYVGNPPSLPPFCALALAPVTGPVGTTFVATCTVTPGTNPTSTFGAGAVSLNAAAVDGGTVALLDDGNPPDLVLGDNIYTGNVTVGPLAAFGAQTLTSTVTDLQARSSTCTANFTVIAPPPANDNCTGAVAISGTGNFPYDTNGATTSTPAATCGAIGTDVWFTWNSGPGGQTTVATCGFTAVDTAIAAYSDCATSIACDDDGCGGVGASTFTFCALANTNYLLRIGDFAGGNPHVGTFSISQVPGSGTPSITAAATPTCGTTGTAVTITARILNAGCPAQTLVSASADASIIGGGTVTLLDDGVAPDTAIDGTFTGSTTYGAAPSAGNIVVTGTFSGAGTATANVAMTTPGGGTDEAGDSLATAGVVTGGPASSIAGSLLSFGSCASTANDVDMYLIRICDPATFSATTVGGTTMDTQLFLFDSAGLGVVLDDDCPAGTLQSCLGSTIVGTRPLGNYYLAISGDNQDPLDAGGALIWANTPFNVERAPDGPGAANALASWDTGGFNSGAYTIALTGVCGVCHGGCVADFDDGNATGTPDGGVGIEDLLWYLDLYDQGLICADVDDGNGLGVQDGGVGIEDLLYFLFRYDAGC